MQALLLWGWAPPWVSLTAKKTPLQALLWVSPWETPKTVFLFRAQRTPLPDGKAPAGRSAPEKGLGIPQVPSPVDWAPPIPGPDFPALPHFPPSGKQTAQEPEKARLRAVSKAKAGPRQHTTLPRSSTDGSTFSYAFLSVSRPKALLPKADWPEFPLPRPAGWAFGAAACRRLTAPIQRHSKPPLLLWPRKKRKRRLNTP
jgi:hypothetical protein